MTIKLITTLTNDPAPNLRRLKQWGADAIMLADGYDEGGIDQFAFIRLYSLNVNGVYIGDMSANNIGPTLSHSDMLNIAALQQADEFTVEQKMEWLTCGGIDEWGCVMRIPSGGNWSTASQVRMVGAVWAGNQVEVIDRGQFLVRYNGVIEQVPMSRIKTFTSLDWGKSYTTNPELVHSVMAVGRDNIPHKPKGNIYLPLLFKYSSVWVFDRWLE